MTHAGAYGANGRVIAGPDADDRVRLQVAAAKAATTAAVLTHAPGSRRGSIPRNVHRAAGVFA
jgi:hypothetical protein